MSRHESLLDLLDEEQLEEQLLGGMSSASKGKPRRRRSKPATTAVPFVPQIGASQVEADDLRELEVTYGDPVASAAQRLHERRQRKVGRNKTKRKHGKRMEHSIEQAIGQANMAFVDKKHAEAISILKQVVALVPDFAPAWTLLARVHLDAGEKQRAIDAYKLALHANPRDAMVWRTLAKLYVETDSMDAAAHAYKKAVGLNSADYEVMLEAAEVLERVGDTKRAVKVLRMAANNPSCPSRQQLYFHIGDLAAKLNDDETLEAVLIDALNISLPHMAVPTSTNANILSANLHSDEEADDDDASSTTSDASSVSATMSATEGTAAAAVRARLLALLEEDDDVSEAEEIIPHQKPANDAAAPSGSTLPSAAIAGSKLDLHSAIIAVDRLLEWVLLKQKYLLVAAITQRINDIRPLADASVAAALIAVDTKCAAIYIRLGQDATGAALLANALCNPLSQPLISALSCVVEALIDTNKDESALEIVNHVHSDGGDVVALPERWDLAESRLLLCRKSADEALTILRKYNGKTLQNTSKWISLYTQGIHQAGTEADIAAATEILKTAANNVVNDKDRAIMHFQLADRSQYLKLDGRFLALLARATGTEVPAETGSVRKRRFEAISAAVGLEKYTTVIQAACQLYAQVGDSRGAYRMAHMALFQHVEEKPEIGWNTQAYPSKRPHRGEITRTYGTHTDAVAYVDVHTGNRRSMHDIVEDVRRFALGKPMDISCWNFLRLLELTNHIAASKNFERVVLRAHKHVPTSLSMVCEIANACLERKTMKIATAFFTELVRLKPREPLFQLCLAVCHLSYVSSRRSLDRHLDLVKSGAYFDMYRQARIAAVTNDAITSSHPFALTYDLVFIETSYNCARACHQVSLYDLAIPLYEQCLAYKPTGAIPPAMDVRKEAAYNYALLLQQFDHQEKAMRIMQQFLTVD